MSKYQHFIFDDYLFTPETKSLQLIYSLDGVVAFTETYHFDFTFTDYDEVALDLACQSLFFMAGVSYYKAYLPPKLVVEKGQLDPAMASFFAKTYQKGLAEFFYVNQLDLHTKIEFPVNTGAIARPAAGPTSGLLIGVGGGKDSLVSIELLKKTKLDLATWSVGHRPQLSPLIERIDLEHYWVERDWDKSLLEHNKSGAYNGHVPISALLSCVGAVVAVLTGRKDIVVSNEQSANEADLIYRGVEVNHQYSKSIEYERDYQAYLAHTLGQRVAYYSLLRPFSEIFIAQLFSKLGFAKYQDVFTSCNRAFTHDSDHVFWCGTCPKCAFTFLILTSFIKRADLESLWHKNLLLDNSLDDTYRQLLGIAGSKPLDCVGEIKESRVAMRLAQQIYPELVKYKFDIPGDYNYRDAREDAMPAGLRTDILRLVKQLI
jgi:UDP-N-acetyl-alpha-D-muramoyl-L-alanyl-L-glutamate epimerase